MSFQTCALLRTDIITVEFVGIKENIGSENICFERVKERRNKYLFDRIKMLFWFYRLLQIVTVIYLN